MINLSLSQPGYYTELGQWQTLGNGLWQNAAQASQAQQAAAFAQYAQQETERRDWMIDGVRMTFKEFADTLYPEPCAEKTHLFLKYSK